MADMHCCICKKKPATVHLTQIVGEKIQKRDLCENCAKAEGVNAPLFTPADLMSGLDASPGTKLIPESMDLERMTVLSAAAKRQLIANSWKLITP